MCPILTPILAMAATVLGTVAIATVAAAQSPDAVAQRADGAIRFATFNAALNEKEAGGILARLRGGADPQARMVAEVIQRVRPDVLVLQELDRDPDEAALAVFAADYLAAGQNGAEPIDYPHRVFPESNTGVLAPVDFDGDGRITLPNDAYGFGFHPGQYAFALLSRHPVVAARTFARTPWADVPGAVFPRDVGARSGFREFRLSSKTHLVADIDVFGTTVHVLAAHPTPPVFDDARDLNGRRNADEIRLLADLLHDEESWYATADAGSGGGLREPARAVLMGDLNADPGRGDGRPGAISRLLDDVRISPVVPQSARGDITATFNGGMRVDYVLPTADWIVTGSGVFWPADDDPLARLNDASDHHLVWVDVRLP